MPSSVPTNTAAYLVGKQIKPLVKEAPYTAPAPVVRGHAVAINPVDVFKQYVEDFLLGWIKYPFVLCGDLAGEIVDVGKGVT